jgi:phosphatidylserine/phosphatidylglycerophosphate/cardiolipin synthase-like enzyme
VDLPIASRVLAKRVARGLLPIALVAAAASTSSATDRIYFSATDNVTDVLVSYINAENVRLDISSWYLSEHSISIAVANRFAAGVPVRIIGDRGAPFENDPHTKTELYWLANQGIPIRLRFNPTWFPEIDHWKAAIFVGENVVEFGSGNFAPTELRPVSATNYCDETELFTDDPAIVNAFKTRFDVMWNDTTKEPESIIAGPPYLKDWNDACAHEPTGNCADYYTLYPAPAPMVINTARLEPDNPTPPDLIWGQGPDFNNRLTKEINAENRRIDLVVYRLEVDNITQALLDRFRAGVPVRIIIDPGQYTNIAWPEFWLTHANIDKLWAAGVPVRQRLHAGVTHMKTLVTSRYATNASSNFGPNWQRDHDYFVSAATKPAIYQAIADRVQTMWNDTVGFGPLQPTPPNAAALASPAAGATGVATST